MATKLKKLFSEKEFLRTAKDVYRQKLADLWNKNIKHGSVVDFLQGKLEKTENKLQKINDKIYKNI